ncbi:SH3 domain-containing protein [Brevibacillus panacihumi]|uniref:SH3 domain-containing protein n=1 Tax=Brevibacillus panacihumi TaxID=497735 RepID=A0A3M8CA66_9BACL|nr:SH3 domain-containing protein [Brevibacillus panacihumi]RNB72431.1 SH3 domain-containing protein [Brevibacillus panacihumi]
MKLFSPYQRSFWVRNILLVLVIIALIGTAYKLARSYQKTVLLGQAKTYFEAQNLVLAEEAFSQADAIQAIRTEDEPWSQLLLRLGTVRLELESLALNARIAIEQKEAEQTLAAYQNYHSLQQQAQRENEQVAAFFQQIAQNLAIENQFAMYYQQAMKEAKDQVQASLDHKKYRDQTFIHTLATIPDEYYGGKEKKQNELEALFLQYERNKLRDLAQAGTFDEVVGSLAESHRLYVKEGFPTEWLISLLERYAKEEINQTIREQDLAEFVNRAKAYREQKSILPSRSDVLALIDRQIETLFHQADQFVRSNRFEKALALYQELSRLEDISERLTELEKRWIAYDPGRLLQAQFPDKTLDTLMTGVDHWGAQVYAVGWDEAEGVLYMAALDEDGAAVKLEQALSLNRKSAIFSLSDTLGSEESPIITVEAAGKERTYAYLGLVPDLSRKMFVKRWDLEADGWEAIQPDQILVKNPVGEGEHEIARFSLEKSGLVYKEKWADYLVDAEDQDEPEQTDEQDSENIQAEEGQQTDPNSGKPADIPALRTYDVYAGPGDTYAIIGQVVEEGYQVIAKENGWLQIDFDGTQGWIRPSVEP